MQRKCKMTTHIPRRANHYATTGNPRNAKGHPRNGGRAGFGVEGGEGGWRGGEG